jgi:ferredoxin
MKEVLGDVSTKTFYLCGPEAMYPYCLKELEILGIPRRRKRTEVFGPSKDVTSQPGWPEGVRSDARFKVKVKGRKDIRGRAGEPLMISMERANIALPSSCRSGECSLCRTKLISGRVFQPPEVKLRKSDRLYGYIHPCLAYPLEDCEIMI